MHTTYCVRYPNTTTASGRMLGESSRCVCVARSSSGVMARHDVQLHGGRKLWKGESYCGSRVGQSIREFVNHYKRFANLP